jgi:hypothetical protein
MEQGERELLAGLPEVGYAGSRVDWDSLRQNAVGGAMGRETSAATHVVESTQGLFATILAELTR